MAIVISGVNNNDKITASDGTIDLLSGVNFVSTITAPAFSATGNITANSINVGMGVQLGNAGVATATTFVGNLTGNVNSTSNLLLQIGGSEKFRVGSSGQLGIGGANYGTSGQVLTSGGSGSAATWSTVTGTTINNNANNRVITGEGGTTLNGEANLTFDGSALTVNGTSLNNIITARAADTNGISAINILAEGTTGHSRIKFSDTAGIDGQISYTHTDRALTFAAGGTTERLRITAAGNATFSGIVTATSFVPTSGQLSHRNIIINGAMTVAQRSVGPLQVEGYRTVDRFRFNYDPAPNEIPFQSQHVLTSGDTGPYEEGFRYSYFIENGNQGTQPSNGNIEIFHRVEAQDIANSNWNYLSSSSFITLSFWAKSSVTQTFYGRVMTETGPASRNFPYEISLVGGVWKKFIIKIPGASNLAFTNTTDSGLRIEWVQAAGTDQSGTAPLNQWSTYSATDRYPAVASTWYDTDNATYEITGVQLEVGSEATPFEFRSYADELIRCMRYYQASTDDWHSALNSNSTPGAYSNCNVPFKVQMRAAPTVNYVWTGNGGNTPTGQSTNFIGVNSFVALSLANSNSAFRLDSWNCSSEL
tara:strand:+ start:2651 stop:4426 length:1776 start_codon:yes stop_codon:yes gene_type:complete